MNQHTRRIGAGSARALAFIALVVCSSPALADDSKTKEKVEVDPTLPICRIDSSTPAALAGAPEGRQNGSIDNPLNQFAYHCLGLTGWSKYDVLSLNGQIQALDVASSVEIVPSYSRNFRTQLADGRIRASYHRFRVGGAIPIDGDRSATFADLSKSGLNEATLILGYEYGRVRIRPQEFQKRARDGLEAARRDCILDQLQRPHDDPLRERGKLLELSTHDQIRAACDGTALSRWMQENGANKYFKSIVQPQWRPREDPTLFGGAELRYTPRVERSFFPLSDPAGNGATPLTQLPADFPSNPSIVRRDLFAAKVYAGSSFLAFTKERNDTAIGKDKEVSIDGSVTYRRDLQFVAGTKDRSICPGGGAIISCSTINTAAPFLLDGWVLGARAAIRIPRLSYLPLVGIQGTFTYALDTDQLGVEVPLFAFADEEGKTEAGVVLNHTGDGRVGGLRLPGSTKISFFLGRKFRLTGRP